MARRARLAGLRLRRGTASRDRRRARTGARSRAPAARNAAASASRPKAGHRMSASARWRTGSGSAKYARPGGNDGAASLTRIAPDLKPSREAPRSRGVVTKFAAARGKAPMAETAVVVGRRRRAARTRLPGAKSSQPGAEIRRSRSTRKRGLRQAETLGERRSATDAVHSIYIRASARTFGRHASNRIMLTMFNSNFPMVVFPVHFMPPRDRSIIAN